MKGEGGVRFKRIIIMKENNIQKQAKSNIGVNITIFCVFLIGIIDFSHHHRSSYVFMCV